MATFLFVFFTISFFISAPFYTANIPQVARFVNNNLLAFSDLCWQVPFLIRFCRLSGIQPVEHFGHRERRIDVRRDVIVVIIVFKQCERV